MIANNIGYVVRSIELVRNAENYIEQRGFGFQILGGAQYLRGLVPVQVRANQPDDPNEYGELHDGKVVACQGGFVGLQFIPSADIPASRVARVAVKIFTLPSVVTCETPGNESKSSIQLFNSTIHPTQANPQQHVMVPANSGLLIADDPGYGYMQNAPPSLAGADRSRSLGGEQRPWWPTSALFFHGFFATDDATHGGNFSLSIFAYVIDGNGTRNIVPYYTWQTGTVLTASYETIYQTGGLTLDKIYWLAHNNVPQNAIPVPPNGFRAWLRNTHATANMPVVGFFGARSA